MLVQLLPGESEVHGLLALMELQASRSRARSGPGGEPVLLPDQDRSLWDQAQIQRGLAELGQAQQLGGGHGHYALQAAIAACHARANTAADTDWKRVVALYDEMLELSPSPIVGLNRAVAVGMAHGPAAGLEALDALASEPVLENYHLVPSVRGDLLARLGRHAEARDELHRALAMTGNARERDLLSRRLALLDPM
jgi:predicted RNA polymerase sigma factor